MTSLLLMTDVAIWGRGIGIRMFGYHDALPRQILVHKDMVSWETPKEVEVRHFVHVALQPWREPLGDHPPGMGEPACRAQWRFESSQSGSWDLVPH